MRQLNTQPAYKGEFQYETKLWKYPIEVERPNNYPGGGCLGFILMNYLKLVGSLAHPSYSQCGVHQSQDPSRFTRKSLNRQGHVTGFI